MPKNTRDERQSRTRNQLAALFAIAVGGLLWSLPAAAGGHYPEEVICTPGHGLHYEQAYDGTLTIYFRPAHYAASHHAPGPGECGFIHRGVSHHEGHQLILPGHQFSRYVLDCVVESIRRGKPFSVQALHEGGHYLRVTRYNESSPYLRAPRYGYEGGYRPAPGQAIADLIGGVLHPR